MAGVLVLVAMTGCGGDKKDDSITVFAATSLTGAFTEIGKAFEHAHDGTTVTFNFAASSQLALQLQEGNPTDVIALADRGTMRAVSTDSAVFARNSLVIVTKPGNPSHIQSLRDLVKASVVSLCGAAVPCGAYAAEALSKASVTLDDSHVSRAPNAAAALAAVVDGDAVAALVYVTDAHTAADRVQSVPIPEQENVIAQYPIAEVRSSESARAFVDFVRGREGQRILKRWGFLSA